MTLALDPLERNVARRLLLTYMWLWLLEGALRKWLLPSLQQPLYFVRVLVVVAAVMYALSRLRRPWPWGAHVGIAFVIAVTIFTATHVISGAQTIIQAVLGTRLWLELVLTPLALGPMLNRRDVLVAARHIVFVSYPIAAIALLQVVSPPTSPINKLFESDGSDNFGNEGGVIRATSLFTSSAGHSAFIALAGAAALIFLLSKDSTERARRMAQACIPVILLMAITSGSRSAIFSLGVILVVAGPGLLRRGTSEAIRVGAVAAAALGMALWLAPRLAPDAIAGILARFSGDGTVAEPQGRVIGAFVGWSHQVVDATIWGRGLGATAQGLRNLGATKQVETELDQWVVQLGPALFVLALSLRLGAIAYLVARAAAAARRGVTEVLPLLALGFIFWPSGPITGQGSINGVGVLVALLLMGTTAGTVATTMESHPEPPSNREPPGPRVSGRTLVA